MILLQLFHCWCQEHWPQIIDGVVVTGDKLVPVPLLLNYRWCGYYRQ
jgi:hypothetical protein